MTKTKNERITTLENEVAELKLIVHELRGKKSIEPSTTNTVEDKPLTSNQQRAAIIEKAKQFVEENQDDYFHVEVDDEKRTVFTWKLITEGKIYKAITGLASCHSDDVFNEHIGKAIALGRALGLDVSEFEQAVQPERAPEQIAMYGDKKVTFKDDDHGYCDSDYGTVHFNSTAAKESKILNDTNALYGGVE